MFYSPKQEWSGQPAFLIGGGSSLSGFDFGRLAGKNVIGINDAFKLGADIVKICLFGDSSFFHKNVHELEKFKGSLVTCSPNLLNINISWLKTMKREKTGLHSGDTLGWNASTGAAAINLAVSLGAVEIFLLGFDGGRLAGKTHWHNFCSKNVPDSSYEKFNKGFMAVAAALAEKPVEVFNVTNGESLLPVFKRIAFTEFFERLK